VGHHQGVQRHARVDEWGDDETNKRKIELDSAKHPEHMFKIGYFRSSYNSGGFENVAGDVIGMGMRDVFNPGDEYLVRPDWTMAREIAAELLRKLSVASRLRVMTVDALPLFATTPTYGSADAVRLVQEERARTASPFDGWYSNGRGHFTAGKPLALIAAVPGSGVFDRPCVHLVYEDPSFEWYVQAAEIVLETIDYVLAQPDREKYVLHWSG
jgi:hypothetical protein